MKKPALFFLLLTFATCSHAQFYSWLREFTGTENAYAHNIDVDANDNLIVIGDFEDGLTIGSMHYNGNGSFVAKFDKNGILIWSKTFTYTSPKHDLVFMKLDANGNIYLTASYSTSVTLGAVTLKGTNDYNNVFIAKLDGNGNLQWAKNLIGLKDITDLSVNSAGDVAFYALAFDTIEIDNTPFTVNGNGFVLLYSSSGNLLWSKAITDGTFFNSWPGAVAVDEARNVYVHGQSLKKTLKLDDQQISGNTFHDLFLAKLNSSGICQWINRIPRKLTSGVIGPNDPWDGRVLNWGDLYIDKYGDLFQTGEYSLEILLGTTQYLGSGNLSEVNIFLNHISKDGTIIWSSNFAQPANISIADNITNRNDKLYISGVIDHNPFFASLNPDTGGEIKPTTIPFTFTYPFGGLVVDSEDSVYISGMQKPPDRDKHIGFLFKYGMKLNPSEIKGPDEICLTQEEILIAGTPIENALSYEWKIESNGIVKYATTSEPSLLIILKDYDLEKNISVSVRGRHGKFSSLWSNVLNVQIAKPLDELTISGNCTKIKFDNNIPFVWHRNEEVYPDEHSEITPTIEGKYFVVSSNFCGTYESNKIHFVPLDKNLIFIPNIITPNDDDTNQYFEVDKKLESSSIQIFNRWGKEVYHASSYKDTWDGDDLADGVYFYTIQSQCLNETLKGPLTIKR
jgi:gliding motility-associated-like protein